MRKILLGSLIIAVAAVAVSLGRWQLRRLAQREASNRVFLAARALTPIRLPDDIRPGLIIDSGRRIVARGHFEPSHQILLRDRVQDDAPGLQVVTLFETDSTGPALWVLRGFVRSPDAVTPPDSIPSPQAGDVSLDGEALAIPVTGDSGRPLAREGITTWQRLDQQALRGLGPPALPVYLLLRGDSSGPGQLPTVAAPAISNGPHLSYAIQWFGIAAAVLTFGVVVIWRGENRGTKSDDVRHRQRAP
ncbi:MAG: SURF1 family protein [Gemmatimonadales bacterium]